MLSDEAQAIVAHFVRHMPLDMRARYEEQVRKMLKQRRNEPVSSLPGTSDDATRATWVCVDVMHALWSQARRQHAMRKPSLTQASGGSA